MLNRDEVFGSILRFVVLSGVKDSVDELILVNVAGVQRLRKPSRKKVREQVSHNNKINDRGTII